MLSFPKPVQVFFLRVTDNATKLQRLCAVVQKHFENKERILITTPSAEAAHYMDQLLWRMPEESCVPHTIVNATTNESIAITTSHTNVNQAPILINLCPEAMKDISTFHTIY